MKTRELPARRATRELQRIWGFVGLIILSGVALSVEVCRLSDRVEALER